MPITVSSLACLSLTRLGVEKFSALTKKSTNLVSPFTLFPSTSEKDPATASPIGPLLAINKLAPPVNERISAGDTLLLNI